MVRVPPACMAAALVVSLVSRSVMVSMVVYELFLMSGLSMVFFVVVWVVVSMEISMVGADCWISELIVIVSLCGVVGWG